MKEEPSAGELPAAERQKLEAPRTFLTQRGHLGSSELKGQDGGTETNRDGGALIRRIRLVSALTICERSHYCRLCPGGAALEMLFISTRLPGLGTHVPPEYGDGRFLFILVAKCGSDTVCSLYVF